MTSKVKAAILDFIHSENLFNIDGSFDHESYAAECRLFNEHFKNMSKEEMNEYKEIVQLLRCYVTMKSLN